MKPWLTLLFLLATAVAAALAWHWLSLDPGYVLIRLHGVSIETTLVFTIAAALLVWIVSRLASRLLRWPFRAWSRVSRRRGRERLSNGFIALVEGRYTQAERQFAKAAQHEMLRAPALLALAYAAHAHGANERASEALDQASVYAQPSALILRAHFLVENKQAVEALALLKSQALTGTLPPRGLHLLIETAVTTGDIQTALDSLDALSRTQLLDADIFTGLQNRVLTAALIVAPDATRLNTVWGSFRRVQRRYADVVEAFAHRAVQLGQPLAAMDALESAQRYEWQDSLAKTYGELGPIELSTRTRTAEAWLAIAPNSAVLLTTLGRLCNEQSLWGKAEEYLERALGIAESAAAWEVLGDCYRGQRNDRAAVQCYANALSRQRGESTQALAKQDFAVNPNTRAVVIEERSEHGVPRLPKSDDNR